MRKSIYYLIANTVSTIAALIFIACISSHLYPVFGFDLIVQSPMRNAFEPFKYVLVVEALSIIFCAQDVISAGNHNGRVPFQVGKNIIGAVISVLSILYTWVSVILVFDNYRIGQEINIPYIFIIFFIVAIAMIIVGNLLSKKNSTFGGSLVSAALLLMISGLLYECLPYWYTMLPCLIVTALVLLLPPAIVLIKQRKATR